MLNEITSLVFVLAMRDVYHGRKSIYTTSTCIVIISVNMLHEITLLVKLTAILRKLHISTSET